MIRNVQRQQDRLLCLSFRRKDQISSDVIWSVFEKITQSNSRFNAMDMLVFDVVLRCLLVSEEEKRMR